MALMQAVSFGFLILLLTSVPTAAQSAPPAGEAVAAASLPGRDPIDLARRYGRIPPAGVDRAVSSAPIAAGVGRLDRFWVLSRSSERYRETMAELRHVGRHAYWYAERGLPVDGPALARSAASFDDRTYPLVRRAFGSEWLPGVDGDSRLTILVADLPDLLAYVSADDEYSRAVLPRSNEREMLYVNGRALAPGTLAFDATLAHEFQHLVGLNVNPDQETWVNEGAADLAASLVARQPGSVRAFEQQPDIPLLGWSDDRSTSGAHYQAAYLFTQYFLERFLTAEDLYLLYADKRRGPALFERLLAERGDALRFDDVFRDWAVANILDRFYPEGGRFGYGNVGLQAQTVASLGPDRASYSGTVHPYGTDYLEIRGATGEVDLVFQGVPEVPLVAADATHGAVWWSNRGDMLDARMTRRFDLSSLESAQLRLRLWFETERDYDYGYVSVSTDGGMLWTPLCLSASSQHDPTGHNLGCGFTGMSGGGMRPEWIEDQVDLTPFVGQEILLRVEYVTDQSFSARGILIDELQIPELGFADSAEQDAGWSSEGFVRSDNAVAQQYSVRLMLLRDNQAEVVDVSLDETASGTARVALPGAPGHHALVAISGLARGTLEPAAYSLELRLGEP